MALLTTYAPAAQTAKGTVAIPAGDSIPVALEEDIGSRNSREGDRFAVVTTADYAVDGRVVLPKGSPGYGTITHIRGARRFHSGGEMTFTLDRLIAPGGGTVAVSTTGGTADADKATEKNGNLAGQIALSAVLCKVCFLAKKGNDMLIKSGTVFHVLTIAQTGVGLPAPGATPPAIDPALVTRRSDASPEPSPGP